MSNKYRVFGDLDYIMGNLRYGRKEMILDKHEYQQFLEMTEEEQREWLDEEGDVVVLDYSVEDCGDVAFVDVEPYE